MNRLRLACLCLSFCCIAASISAQENNKKPKMVRVPTAGNKVKVVDESKEPPLYFELKIDGKTFKGKVGEAIELKGTFKNAKATVTTSKSRKFNYAGISFSYPEKMVWQTELADASSKSWVMAGASCSINVFDVEGTDYSAEDYAKVLIEDFDTDDFDEEDFEIELGGKKYKGIRLIFEFDGESYVYDIIKLPNKDERSRLILLEEVAPDRDPDNVEAKQVLKLFQKTFKVEK